MRTVNIIKAYVNQVRRGEKTLEEVPKPYRADVERILYPDKRKKEY